MQQRLTYINQGRGGYVVYHDQQGEIKMDFEFGGGNCVAIIFVPSTKEWEGQTNRPLDERETVLTFMAEQAIKDQAPGGNYKLSENYIEIFI